MIGMDTIKDNIRLKMNSPSQGSATNVFMAMSWKVIWILIDMLQLLQYRSYDFICSARRFVLVQPFLNIPKIEFKLMGYAIRMCSHFRIGAVFRFSSPAKKSSFEMLKDSMDWFNRQAKYSGETGNPSAARLTR